MCIFKDGETKTTVFYIDVDALMYTPGHGTNAKHLHLLQIQKIILW